MDKLQTSIEPRESGSRQTIKYIPIKYDERYDCHLDNFMNKSDKPLIGVEYVLELHGLYLKEPYYICTLCDKRCDPRNIMSQMTSHNHRMRYLVS